MNNHYQGVSQEDFIQKIVKEKLSAIGLTNYFNFTQQDFDLKKELENSGVTVFLNLEIRLSYQNKEDECCDAHIIFDSSITKNAIDNFLTKLNIDYAGTTKMAKDLSTQDEFEKSTIEFTHLKEVLNEESLGLRDKHFLGFLSRGKGNGRSSTNYEKLAINSDFLIHSSDRAENIEEDRTYWLGKNKPLVQSSDAHSTAEIGLKYTWIKADTTFKGLEQILYEPSDRVRIQQLTPEERSPQLIIDRIEYKSSNGQLQIVPLNQNLNSLIGSRAQGKSNLLKNIAYATDPEQTRIRNVYKSDFIHLRDFKVFWADGDESSLDAGEEKEKGLLFIPQKFLGELLFEKDPQFDQFLTSLFENRGDFKQGLETYRKLSDQILLTITSTLRELLEARQRAISKSQELRKLGNKDGYVKESGELEGRIKTLGEQAAIKEEDLKKYDELNESRLKVKKEMEAKTNDVAALSRLNTYEIINTDNIQEFEFSQSTYDKIKKQLEKNDEAFKKDFVKSEIGALNQQLEIDKKALAQLEEGLKPLQEKIKKHEALITLTKRQSAIKESIKAIDLATKELDEIRGLYTAKKRELVAAYPNYEKGFQNLMVTFPALKFSDINLVISFNNLSLGEWAEQYINYHNSLEFKKDEGKNYKLANAFLEEPSTWKYEQESFLKLLTELIDGILRGQLILKAGQDMESAIQALLKNRFSIDFLESVRNKQNIGFNEMSDGERMLSLLEMIFKFDDYNYPVLLDQPEDDLDSKAISTTVVDFLTSEKSDRQIIIASHNANLVVCGDSENILISSKSPGAIPNFSYTNGAIENETINKEILEILEGGSEAFEKRRKKIGHKL